MKKRSIRDLAKEEPSLDQVNLPLLRGTSKSLARSITLLNFLIHLVVLLPQGNSSCARFVMLKLPPTHHAPLQ